MSAALIDRLVGGLVEESTRPQVRAAAIVGLLVATVYVAWRGVWRGLLESGDLAVGFSSALAWLHGGDPYDVSELQRQLEAAGGAGLTVTQLELLRNVYVPATIPMFIPLTPLSWPDARIVWVTLNLVATLVVALGMTRLMGWRPTSTRAIAFVAFILALAPVHATMASGQTTLVAAAFLVAALLAERSGSPRAAGLFLGLATAFKLQVALPFAAYYLLRRRWTLVAAAGLAFGAISLLSIVRMSAAGVAWLDGWAANLTHLSRPGGLNDPSLLNPDRHSLIDLEYVFQSIVPNAPGLGPLALVLTGMAALALVRWTDESQSSWIAMSGIAVLSLLAVYHRYYDAVLLAIPVAWGLSIIGTSTSRIGVAIVVLGANFLFPFQTGLNAMAKSGALPAWLTGNPLWAPVVLSQHVWALVLMSCVLLYAAMREHQRRRAANDSLAELRQRPSAEVGVS